MREMCRKNVKILWFFTVYSCELWLVDSILLLLEKLSQNSNIIRTEIVWFISTTASDRIHPPTHIRTHTHTLHLIITTINYKFNFNIFKPKTKRSYSKLWRKDQNRWRGGRHKHKHTLTAYKEDKLIKNKNKNKNKNGNIGDLLIGLSRYLGCCFYTKWRKKPVEVESKRFGK